MEALRSQLNHHFIKNAIGRSNAKVLSDDMEEANRFLGSLASLLEIMMLSTKKDFYRLSDEIEIIRSYLNIQRERWNKIFAFELQVEPQLHLHEIFIPSLLTQPVVENAVEHGALSKKDGSGKIRITWSLNGQNLLCAIEDNGKNGSILPASRHHNGLENVRTRIQILNNLYRTAISLQIKINKEGGVCAIFSFPLIQTEPDEYSEL